MPCKTKGMSRNLAESSSEDCVENVGDLNDESGREARRIQFD